MSQIEMEEELVTMLAGRAAESVVFDSVTTGAANDIERATAIARAMVTQYGMSEKFGLMSLESVEERYLSGHTVLNCGQETATEIDKEVMQILKVAYEKAEALLKENRECMDRIAEFVMEKETITGKEFMKILREVTGIPEPEPQQKTPDTAKPESANVVDVTKPEPVQDEVDGWKTVEEPQTSQKRADGVETIASRKLPEDE